MTLPGFPLASRRARSASALLLLAGAGALASTADAGASSSSAFYASTSGSSTAATCPSSAPCSLGQAVSLAGGAAGSDVVVEPGTYSVSSALTLDNGITLEGDPAGARPVLQGGPALTATTVTATGGATVRYLEIDSTTSTTKGYSALALDGASAQNLIVTVAPADQHGTALDVQASTGSTTVSTVLAEAQAAYSEAISFSNVTAPNTATVLHATAVAAASQSDAISSALAGGGEAYVEDSIADGSLEVKPAKNGITYLPASFAYSDLDGAASSSYTDGGNNIADVPQLSAGYQENDGAPTIGAGYAYPGQTASDLGGTAWGCPPDMGAFQSGAGCGSASSGGGNTQGSGPGAGSGQVAPPSDSSPALPPLHAPVAGKSVALHPAGGYVAVELPGTSTLIPLGRAASIPAGTIVDTTRGQVKLTSAVSTTGAVKTGTFSGGRFVVSQTPGAHPLTTLKLAGGSFAVCRVAAAADTGGLSTRRALTFARRRTSRRVIRLLWGSDHGGRFQSFGRSASATVRGTVWLTEDRCDGTLVVVRRGAVVVHDKVTHRNVLVRAGHSYLARASS